MGEFVKCLLEKHIINIGGDFTDLNSALATHAAVFPHTPKRDGGPLLCLTHGTVTQPPATRDRMGNLARAGLSWYLERFSFGSFQLGCSHPAGTWICGRLYAHQEGRLRFHTRQHKRGRERRGSGGGGWGSLTKLVILHRPLCCSTSASDHWQTSIINETCHPNIYASPNLTSPTTRFY